MKKLNWCIIGTGAIANELAESLLRVNGEIYGAYNRTYEKALLFSKKYNIKKTYQSIEDVMNDTLVDIVYISTPHNAHYELIKKSLENNKHVLCEKAITVNSQQLREVMELANEKNLKLMEAMTIYNMPIYKVLKDKIDQGIIGKVKMIQVNFGSCKDYDVTNRFFSKDLAGGALLDIGVYATAFARYFMSKQPHKILTTHDEFETGVDEQSGIILQNTSGELSVISLTMRAKQPKRGIISGELGYIDVNDYPRATQATIVYTKDGSKEIIDVGNTTLALDYEVIHMEKSIIENDQTSLLYTHDVMDILTKVRHQWGIIYPFENKE